MKQRRSGLMALVLVFVLVLGTACGGGGKTLKSGLDLKPLGDKLLAEITWQDKDLAPLPEKLWDRYIEQVSKDDLKQYLVIAGGGSTAEEIALFEAKDKAAAERVAEAMRDRYRYFREAYSNYTPEQLKNLENPVLVLNGNYVFSVFCKENDKALKIVNDWIAEQS